MDKRGLYESIMSSVAKEVKKVLSTNELDEAYNEYTLYTAKGKKMMQDAINRFIEGTGSIRRLGEIENLSYRQPDGDDWYRAFIILVNEKHCALWYNVANGECEVTYNRITYQFRRLDDLIEKMNSIIYKK